VSGKGALLHLPAKCKSLSSSTQLAPPPPQTPLSLPLEHSDMSKRWLSRALSELVYLRESLFSLEFLPVSSCDVSANNHKFGLRARGKRKSEELESVDSSLLLFVTADARRDWEEHPPAALKMSPSSESGRRRGEDKGVEMAALKPSSPGNPQEEGDV